ncbi:MAG: LCP family protein [Thermoanaerobacterales bacterium]|nr:LCP family protein [Thermoanaerobacterales bacterium]
MKKILKYTLIVLLFAAISAGCGFYYVLNSLNKPSEMAHSEDIIDTDEFIKGGRLNILLLGIDSGTIGANEKYNRHRSDTMMVLSIDEKQKQIKILSIPRDTRVKIQGVGIEKINAAMAYGGPSLSVKTVKEFLGVPIHNYVVLNYKGLRQIVDALGGIEINVERRMKYDDYAGNVHIDIQPGVQVLDGKNAEDFVRFRQYPEGDLGRVKAQQQFIDAFVKTVMRPSTILKLPKIISVVQGSIETDIEPLEMASYLNLCRQISKDDVKMFTLPGEGKYISGISYFIPYQSSMDDMIQDIFFDDDNIQVAVLNGSGEAGIASKVAKQLEAVGFKVVKVANADSFDYETTPILYPRDKKVDADKIAQVFTDTKVIEELCDDAKLATVIVGKDIK